VTGQELLRREFLPGSFLPGGEVAAARKNGKFFRLSRIAGSSNFAWTLFFWEGENRGYSYFILIIQVLREFLRGFSVVFFLFERLEFVLALPLQKRALSRIRPSRFPSDGNVRVAGPTEVQGQPDEVVRIPFRFMQTGSRSDP
jgi:hypothetical protein